MRFKKWLALALSTGMVFAFASCGSQNANELEAIKEGAEASLEDVSPETEIAPEAPALMESITEESAEEAVQETTVETSPEASVEAEQETSEETTQESTESAAQDSEEMHVHAYEETVTIEAACETDGLKTFTCDCEDTYTEVIPALGHHYESYVYNDDATYQADGTETAVCTGCELSDTRSASGTKLEYTYADLDKTMYAKSSVNVRDLPSAEGNKMGSLSTAQAVTVTGYCVETSWYRIDYNGSVAYVSNNYLVDTKPVVATPTPAPVVEEASGATQESAAEPTEPPYDYQVYYRGEWYTPVDWNGETRVPIVPDSGILIEEVFD